MWWRWIDVEAPAEAAWDLLIDLDRWPEWGPSLTGARLDGGGRRLVPAATGAVRTPIGAWVPFQVTSWSDGRAWGWRVARVPATEHRVEPLGPDRCRVGFGVPTWAPAYLVICAVALRRIATLARAAASA